MTFLISFHASGTPGAHGSVLAETEVDGDYEVIVMVACKALSEAGVGNFRISGFGADLWPLDVAYDFSAFMEQFPFLLGGLREGRKVAVDLYSQGVERELIIYPSDSGVVKIKCVSRTEWVPHPEFESIDQKVLISMLAEVVVNFVKGLKDIDFELADEEPLVHWLNGEV
jgi:hypothetical protein